MREWKRFDELPRQFVRAYRRNISSAPDFSENLLPNGAMIFQSGGAFPRLRFRRAKMSGVCCEVLAAYNAIKLSGYEADFLKLSAEFEYGAAFPSVPPGIFGSDPFKIAKCFSSYGVSFWSFNTAEEFDKALDIGKIGVVSYRFGRIDPRIHTFAVERTSDCVLAYNRYSNHREPLRAGSAAETLFNWRGGKPVFLIGYIIENRDR